MVNFYVYRIKKGKMELEDVPLKWRANVEEKLAEGEVANAPWGASSATVHYNTTT